MDCSFSIMSGASGEGHPLRLIWWSLPRDTLKVFAHMLPTDAGCRLERQPKVNCDAYLWPWLLCGLSHGTCYKAMRGPEASVPVDRQKLCALYDKHIVPWKPGRVIYPILLIASKSQVHPASREGHNSYISMTGVPRSHCGNPCWMGDIDVVSFGK